LHGTDVKTNGVQSKSRYRDHRGHLQGSDQANQKDIKKEEPDVIDVMERIKKKARLGAFETYTNIVNPDLQKNS